MKVDKISVVVSTYNRVGYLKQCLEALVKVTFPEFEIIVVNDGSTDGTKEFLDSIGNKKIRAVHHEKNKGLSAARNTGAISARFEVVAFTDDDCTVDEQWLAELANGFTDEKIGFVNGQTLYVRKNYNGYFPERLVSNINAKWPGGGNIAYTKKVFAQCGGFDTAYFAYNNEDSEMAIRAVSNGFQYNRAPKAIIYHQAVNWTVSSLLRSAKNASVWPILKKKYPNYYLHFGPPVTFGCIVYAKDYAYIAMAPLVIPLLLVRYFMHGKRDLKLFFTKWPLYLLLRRLYIYKESIKNSVFMI